MNPYEAPVGATPLPVPPPELAGVDGFSATYAVAPSMVLSSSSQYFFAIALGWRWFGVVFTAAYAVLCVLLDFQTISAVAFSVAAIMTALWIKAYFQYRNIALSQVQLSGNMRVTIELTKNGIQASSARGTVSYAWSELNRLKQSRDFLFIMRDKLPVMSLPKSQFSPEAITFLRSHIGNS